MHEKCSGKAKRIDEDAVMRTIYSNFSIPQGSSACFDQRDTGIAPQFKKCLSPDDKDAYLELRT